VICAALWPDPVDDLCPQAFRDAAATILADFAEQVRNDAQVAGLVSDHWQRWRRTNKATFHPADNFAVWPDMREALLDFIADFANWDASTVPAFLNAARALTQAAHESLGGLPGSRPLVADPFAGGGAIPLEALRVGADTFASDLNSVSVLFNKILLEYIPTYGQRLIDELNRWSEWAIEEAKLRLAQFYPSHSDGTIPTAYLWARTIISEAPDDGVGIPIEIPLLGSMQLSRRKNGMVALRWVRDKKGKVKTETVEVKYSNGITRLVRRPLLEIFEPQSIKEIESGTTARGAATCPVTGYTTPVNSVKKQLKVRNGGSADARLFCVVTMKAGQQGRYFRLPTKLDEEAAKNAEIELYARSKTHTGPLSLVPDEPTPKGGGSGAGRAFSQRNYGMDFYSDLFTPRQALALSTYVELVNEYVANLEKNDVQLAFGIASILSLVVNRLVDLNASLCVWQLNTPNTAHVFGRWALPVVLDFGEVNPLAGAGGSPESVLRRIIAGIQNLVDADLPKGNTEQASATLHPLPNDLASAFITDPPYYDAIPYADLSDFFYIWMKRTLPQSIVLSTFAETLSQKEDECIVDEIKGKDKHYFETMMTQAMAEGNRILRPDGIGVVVFAHKSTTGWEAQLQSMIDARWTVTASWPIDTEMQSRLRAKGSAVLASSIHLVCRIQEGSNIGDWRDVLQELPQRIHTWLPRLAEEGVVGADAIFACLGPALEIFSRYSRVEKASGEPVLLKEYLEQVWAAVSKEALSMVFSGADASALEEDARLTAMWLWTLNTSAGERGSGGAGESEEEEDEEEGSGVGKKAVGGFSLEYDAARKIAQGLGAHLERLGSLVEVKGETARLLPVSARAGYLFGKDTPVSQAPARPKKRGGQMSLFENDELGMMNDEYGMMTAELKDSSFIIHHSSLTILDRVHQSMLLFAAGRSDALKGFLVDEGVGQNARFWQLANALSALYPPGAEEKRWVEGVLARKKGLGF
jgi:adenine-specific DNA methylase